MKRVPVLIFAMLLLSSPIASADPPTPGRPKSKGVATSISLGATLIPVGIGLFLIANDLSSDSSNGKGGVAGAFLLGAGALFGPSFGRVYGQDRKPFSLLPLRIGGAGVGLLGLALVTLNAVSETGTNDAQMAVGLIGFGVGSVMYLTGTVIDIVRAPKAVDKYNQRTIGARWQVRPVYYSASHAVGAKLTLRF